ncbi:MAG TPA: HAD-IA family hydrolase [Patescibacteria group bacterium]|nr:HAD-IA family hydrolase [Patescibacteria group bacterium]
MNKAILFDFDGVLVDSFKISYDSSVLVHHGKLTLKLYRKLFEGNIHESLGNKKFKLKKKEGVNFNDYYGPGLEKLDIIPNASRVIKTLSKNYKLIIVSSTPSIYIKRFFKRHKILKYFTQILGADFHTSKVNKIKYIFSKYSLKPKDCLFITDTLGDVREARKCGTKSIAVTNGFHPVSTLKKGKPFKIIRGIENLPQAVNKYFNTKK